MSVLEALYGTENPDLLLNVSTSENFSRELGKKLWRYDVGQNVLLRVGASYVEKKSSAFSKTSTTGSFSRRTYVVARRVLKSSGDLFLCPLYQLSKVTGLVYEADLLPVNFSSQRDASPVDDPRDGVQGEDEGDVPHLDREGLD